MALEWVPLGISAAGVGLSYVVAIRKARSDAHQEKIEERERASSLEHKIDRVIDGLDRVRDQVRKLSDDVSNLQIRVAVHDDRLTRPIRSVSGDC